MGSGPVTMCQFGSEPRPVPWTDGVSSDWARAEGSVLTVTNSMLEAAAPRVASACSISAASTGQMSLHGALKNVRTITRPGCAGTDVGRPPLVGQCECRSWMRRGGAQTHECRQWSVEGAIGCGCRCARRGSRRRGRRGAWNGGRHRIEPRGGEHVLGEQAPQAGDERDAEHPEDELGGDAGRAPAKAAARSTGGAGEGAADPASTDGGARFLPSAPGRHRHRPLSRRAIQRCNDDAV